MKVYKISREDLLSKIPKDILSFFEENAKQKGRWMEKRLIEIFKNVT